MFLIANVTNEIYTIGDLNITLNAGEATDLDARRLKLHPDQSKDLKALLKSQKLKVLRRDYADKRAEVTPVAKRELLAEIKEMLRSEIKSHLKNAPAAEGKPAGDSSEVLQAIQSLAEMLKKGKPEGAAVQGGEDDGIDPEVLVKLHEKAVEKQRNKMDGQVTTEKQTVHDSDVKDRASELDDLMG